MSYRDFDYYDNEDIFDEEGNNDKCYVQKDKVDDILDNIENEVNDIKDDLEQYTNLTEINDIFLKIKKLSDDLY